MFFSATPTMPLSFNYLSIILFFLTTGLHSDSGFVRTCLQQFQTTSILILILCKNILLLFIIQEENLHINTILICAVHGSASIWLSHLLGSLFFLDIPIVLMIPNHQKYKSYQSLLFLAVTHLPGSGSGIPFSAIQSLGNPSFLPRISHTRRVSETSPSLTVEASPKLSLVEASL
jgi:hypothetical protein